MGEEEEEKRSSATKRHTNECCTPEAPPRHSVHTSFTVLSDFSFLFPSTERTHTFSFWGVKPRRELRGEDPFLVFWFFTSDE